MDVHTRAVRSKNMRAIKSKNTRPEIFVRRLLHSVGFGFRLHLKELPGTPDIVLRKYKAIIFIHGCFWHGHNCHLFKLPKTRTKFWSDKINGNIKRDQKAYKALTLDGWKVLYIWECALKGTKKLETGILKETIEEWLIAIDQSAAISYRGISLL